jgi:hypothetical protein
MLSLTAIHALNQEMGRRAAQAQRTPPVIANPEEIASYARLALPNLGTYVPAGWREVDMGEFVAAAAVVAVAVAVAAGNAVARDGLEDSNAW